MANKRKSYNRLGPPLLESEVRIGSRVMYVGRASGSGGLLKPGQIYIVTDIIRPVNSDEIQFNLLGLEGFGFFNKGFQLVEDGIDRAIKRTHT